MIKAKHHFLIDPFFRWYVIWKMNRFFHDFKFLGKFNDQNKPVLLICNHVSWWDGIWALHFNQKFLKRKYHFMMLEEELRKNWFFQYTGGFSVRKKSKSIIESIAYTSELLSDNKNTVLLFPTGKIQSIYRENFIFEKGVEKILQKANNQIHVIFMANLVDYFSNPKPSLYCYFEEFNGGAEQAELQNEYNRFYRACLGEQTKIETE